MSSGSFGGGTFGGGGVAPVFADGLRFRYRHVHQTVCDYLKSQMMLLNWGDASLPSTDPANANVPFGAAPLTYMEIQPDEEGQPVAVNTVAITLGDGGTDLLDQMGGGFYDLDIPVYFDVYGENQGITVSIACDIKDIVSYEPTIWVNDYTSSAAGVPTTEQIRFEDVYGPERPPASQVSTDFRKHWRMVRGMLHVFHT
jgi:hypothetical protein